MIREVSNGLTMILPVVAMIRGSPRNIFGYTSVLGTTCNAMASCAYHLSCAAKLNADPVNCVARKLDQTFIHVACIFHSYGASKSIHYAALNGAINTRFIRLLWKSGTHDTPKARRFRVFLAFVLYVTPIILRDVKSGMHIVCILLLSSGAFIFDKLLGGMGHSMFHVGLGLFSRELARAL